MTETKQSARLREAARVLRDTARGCKNASATNWWPADVLQRRLNDMPTPDAAYIALMAPPIALALADWLDSEAATEEYRMAEFGYRTATRECLAVADVINGDAA